MTLRSSVLKTDVSAVPPNPLLPLPITRAWPLSLALPGEIIAYYRTREKTALPKNRLTRYYITCKITENVPHYLRIGAMGSKRNKNNKPNNKPLPEPEQLLENIQHSDFADISNYIEFLKDHLKEIQILKMKKHLNPLCDWKEDVVEHLCKIDNLMCSIQEKIEKLKS